MNQGDSLELPTQRIACALILLFACVFEAKAGDQRQVQFAGIAFTGPASETAVKVPHAYSALGALELGSLNNVLLSAIKSAPPTNFSVDTNGLATLEGKAEVLVMALSIDRETAYEEEIDGNSKAVYELAAQALFFDFKARQIVFTYPITLQQIAVLPGRPSSADYDRMARSLIHGQFNEALVPTFARELQSVSIPPQGSRRFQITTVRVDGTAREMAPDAMGEEVLAHEFTKLFASELRIPVLPHSSGQAIGGAMAARIADGRVFNLSIPEPDYQVSVDVQGFKSKVLKETAAYRQMLFGAYYRISIEEPLSGSSIFNQSLRQGNTRTIPVTQTRMNESAAYRETLLAGFSSFVNAAKGVDGSWVAAQADPAETKRQIKEMRILVEKSK